MVVLTFTVTDAKGKYVTGLKPDDLRVLEDGVSQKTIAFAEGTKSSVQLVDMPPDAFASTKVFILFDTVIGCTRVSTPQMPSPNLCGADRTDSIAVYKFSRNLFRSVSLTIDRDQAHQARSAVAGDELPHNTLLLTLRDAADTGRKAVVVFSERARQCQHKCSGRRCGLRDEGIPIYIVSTCEAQEQISANVFQRLTARTGGHRFGRKPGRNRSSVYVDSGRSGQFLHRGLLSSPSSNGGFRKISVEVVSDTGKKYVEPALIPRPPALTDERERRDPLSATLSPYSRGYLEQWSVQLSRAADDYDSPPVR
jgi:hypothetical protein